MPGAPPVCSCSVRGGYAASPVLFGESVERAGDYVLGWMSVIGIFLPAAILMLVWWAMCFPRKRGGLLMPLLG